MFKKVWDFLGSLKLTFWILISIMLTFFIGTQLFGLDYDLFHELNRTSVQSWFVNRFADNAHIAWWVPLLFITMTLLAVNTFICTWNRVTSLLKIRSSLPFKRFLVLLTPSIIHAMFIIILIGHFVTFTCGKWEKHTISVGTELAIGSENFKVIDVNKIKYPETSRMNHLLKQINVTLSDKNGQNHKLSFMSPLRIDGKHVLLGKMKKKNIPRDCSEEGDEFMFRVKKNKSDLFITIISDPGLYIIVGGFMVILLFMPWYFYELSINSKQK